jgi:hypothetical protein
VQRINLSSRIIGRMSAAAQAILPALLYYCSLQHLKNTLSAFQACLSYDAPVVLNPQARLELSWWIAGVRDWNGRTIRTPTQDLVIASLLGWGAQAEGLATGRLWSPQERLFHINVLEMMAGTFVVKTLARDKRNPHIRIRMDNTSAVAYLNHLGAPGPQA